MKVGFIGLGTMGSRMAARLLETGHEVIVYNRTASRTEELEKMGAKVARSPFEVAEANVVITMLSGDKAVEEVVYGEEGLLKNLRSESIHISMGTISAHLAEQLNMDHLLLDTNFVGAPVFGQPEAASSGDLFIAAGGEGGILEKCRPIFEALSKRFFQIGNEPSLALQCH